MGVIQDLAAVKVQESTGSGGVNFLPELYLRDGEKAFVRFLSKTDGSDDRFGVARVHGIRRVSQKTQKPYFFDQYCTMEDTGQCVLCDKSEEDKNVGKASQRLAIWMFVEKVYHKHQNQRAGEDDQEVWVKSQGPNGIVYVETVGAVRLLKKGVGKGGYFINFFKEFRNKYGRLDSRTYEITRMGATKETTSYLILPQDKESEMGSELEAIAESLPSIEAVLMNRVAYDRDSDTYSVVDEGDGPEETVENLPSADSVAAATPKMRVATRATKAEVEEDAGDSGEVQETALSRLSRIAKSTKVSEPDENGLVELVD